MSELQKFKDKRFSKGKRILEDLFFADFEKYFLSTERARIAEKFRNFSISETFTFYEDLDEFKKWFRKKGIRESKKFVKMGSKRLLGWVDFTVFNQELDEKTVLNLGIKETWGAMKEVRKNLMQVVEEKLFELFNEKMPEMIFEEIKRVSLGT